MMIDAIFHFAARQAPPDLSYPSPVKGNSGLARIIAFSAASECVMPTWVAPSFELIERTEYIPSAPRHSPPHLQSTHQLLVKRPDLLLEDISTTPLDPCLYSASYGPKLGGGPPYDKLLTHKKLKADRIVAQHFVSPCLGCKTGTCDASCLKRPRVHPITFDQHLNRASFRPSLQDVNEIELTDKMVRRNPFGNWNPWENRKTLKVKVPSISPVTKELRLPHGSFRFKVSGGELNLPPASLWCKTCVERKVLTNVNGVDIVLEQQGKFVDFINPLDKEGNVLPHVCSAPTISNDSMSVERLQSWLNHRTRRGATPRLRVFTHQALSEEHRPVLLLPVVSYTPPLLTYSSGVVARVPKTRCQHLRRSVTFSTGETIKMCPGCTRFDAARQRVLKDGTIPQANAEMITWWDLRLKEHARELSTKWGTTTLIGGYQLCNDCAEILINGDRVHQRRDGAYTHVTCDPLKRPLDLSVWTFAHVRGHESFHDPNKIDTIVHAIAQDTLSGGKKVNTHSWSEEKDQDDDDLAMSANPDKQDRSVRDHRANGIDRGERPDKKATTREGWSFKVCLYSKCPLHEPFLGPANKKCCKENCRKRHSEEMKKRRLNN